MFNTKKIRKLRALAKKKAIVQYILKTIAWLDGRGLVITDWDSIENELMNNFGDFHVLEYTLTRSYDATKTAEDS
ncbi:hypothetical protein IH575_04570 [Candidatus Dojkabacteria bacterium]|nr:hypothetical protein [Candidatus Dojkabacteria bacterium]